VPSGYGAFFSAVECSNRVFYLSCDSNQPVDSELLAYLRVFSMDQRKSVCNWGNVWVCRVPLWKVCLLTA